MKRIFKTSKNAIRQVRHARVRSHLVGSAATPRLSVFRGVRSMIVQLIDDEHGKTLCYASVPEVKGDKAEGRTGKVAIGYLLGKKIAEKAVAKGITSVVFDRGGYQYHGRVQAVADGAREGGLKF